MPDKYSKRLSAAQDNRKELSKIMVEQELSDIVCPAVIIKNDTKEHVNVEFTIKIKSKKLNKAGNLEIYPEVLVDGEPYIFPKNVFPLIYVSPPYRIGTGVFRTETIDEQEVQIEGSEENPKKALEAIVLRTITNLIKKWQQ